MSALSKGIQHLRDIGAERIIISALIKYGADLFYEIDEILCENDFSITDNKKIFSTIKYMVTQQNVVQPDLSSILNRIDPNSESFELSEYLVNISQEDILKENVKPFCEIVARLSLARNLRQRLQNSINDLGQITGEESLTEIINCAEKPIIDFTDSVISNSDTISMGNFIDDYIRFVKEGRGKHKGVPSGFPRWDMALGGGLRKPGVHLVGARAKVGKSFMGLKVSDSLVRKNIPVLYLDTELTQEIVMARWLALLSDLYIDEIEDGVFLDDPKKKQKVIEARTMIINDLPFFYNNISGLKHTEWLSIIRRWIMTEVGFDKNGYANDCLIVLDYIKLMNLGDTGNFAEWQYLGQIITDLHNCCIKYHVPMLSFVQLNREGIHKTDQGVIAGSDRLIALCSSLSILRVKNTDDLADDPVTANYDGGDRKIEVVATRFGAGLPDGEYINIWTDLSKSQMIEGRTNIENRNAQNSPSNMIANNDNPQISI